MKIELNLSEVFEDEDGNILTKDFVERIEEAIVLQANNTINNLVVKKFEKELSQQVVEAVSRVLDDLTIDLLDKEFIPTGRFGDRGKPTTLRNQICGDIEKSLVWKDPSSYGSDQSTYTKIVKELVNAKLKEFAKEFNKTVDETFVAECMQYAVDKIKKLAGDK